MKYKEKVKKYFTDRGIRVGHIEQKGETESIVCHIPEEQNEEIVTMKDEMEKELNVAVMQSEMFGMNVVIVESKDIE